MTDTKRWSETSSEVDPVLRSVMRYAQEQGPSPEQLRRLLRRTASAPALVRARPRRARPFLVAMSAGLAAALGGLAWASYLGVSPVAPTATPSSSAATEAAPETARRPKLASIAAAPIEASPAPAEVEPHLVASSPSRSTVTPRSSASGPVEAAPVDLDSSRDAVWLQQARAAVASDPARALVLVRDHEVHFPQSPLVEERRALQIEALAHLGRHTEAVRQFAQFEAQFPRSPYRRRLRTLISP